MEKWAVLSHELGSWAECEGKHRLSVNIHGSRLSDDTVQAEASSSCVFPALGEQVVPSNYGPKQALLPKLLSSHQGKHYPNYFSSEAYLIAGASSMVHSGCLGMTESRESLMILLNGYQEDKDQGVQGSQIPTLGL